MRTDFFFSIEEGNVWYDIDGDFFYLNDYEHDDETDIIEILEFWEDDEALRQLLSIRKSCQRVKTIDNILN